ncbi:MAG TPA: nicotinate-nucleotide adenylyltransferase [Burkholderiales bacterium]|nr:nicotinate-nucleotide adenylyltransferase [Burkholderiales bacterium]
MKAGILGGTFDPVHHAHLAMARAALEHLKLDKVLFLPTGSPRYRTPAVASGEHRVAMLRLALGEERRYEIDTRELAPGASGYTLDTLKELRLELGADTELWLLMGADQYAKLDTWHRPDDVKRLAKIAVFSRPGVSIEGHAPVIPMQPMKISASDIRARVASGGDISALVPPGVANYIAQHRPYG